MRARRSLLVPLLTAAFVLPLLLAGPTARGGDHDSPYVDRRKPGH